MTISGIIWRREVVDKLWWKHSVTTDEVEEPLANAKQFRLQERGRVKGEDLYAAYGTTDGGRYLTVFFIHKSEGEALIVTARDMDKSERKRYG